MDLIFATQNTNKFKEFCQILAEKHHLLSLNLLNFNQTIDEPYETLEKNAIHKAKFIAKRYDSACFADDSGLEVDAINNAPGVYSARYAGKNATDDQNIEKLLTALKTHKNRCATFKTVVAFVQDKKTMIFKGHINGLISKQRKGGNGFGYDPVFIPNGCKKTFAELSFEEKNTISHRKIAIKKFVKFLNTID